MSALQAALAAELDQLTAAQRRRACPELAGPDRIHFTRAGQPLLAFASNDYLGLAAHPALAAAAAASAARGGFGGAAARLVTGDLPDHRALEAALAAFLGTPTCLLFPTGYQANLAAVSALAGPADLIVSDAANHASLIDGCRLSRATVRIYRHADAADAADALHTPGTFRRRLLVTESLFSMDGDVAPLAPLAEAAAAVDGALIVDEAHALGVLGPGGRGLCAAAAITPDVLVGTLGKAFGSFGGFIAGSAILRDYLVNRARTFIFTTAPPPPLAAAGVAAVALVCSAEGDARRRRLADNLALLAQQLAPSSLLPAPPAGPIVPILLGTDHRALATAAALAARGIFVPAIRPPTVPEGTARLRVTLSADHQPDEIAALADALTHLPPA